MTARRLLPVLALATLAALPATSALGSSADDASAIANLGSRSRHLEIDWRPSTRHLRSISVDFVCPGSKVEYNARKTMGLGKLPSSGKISRTVHARFAPYDSSAEGARTGAATITLHTTIPSADQAAFRGTVSLHVPGCKLATRHFSGRTSVS